MGDGILIIQNKDGVWEEYKPPYTIIEFKTKEDYEYFEGILEAYKKMEWIPVSKQQPYEDGKPMRSVLVTMEDYKGYRFVTNTLDKRATRENKVVAWMPVPEPYKGEA